MTGGANGGGRTGVLLLNLGGPWTTADVKPFLIRLFNDRDIIRFPGGSAMQPLWARFLASIRSGAVRDRYEQIGGGSPLLFWTRLQARHLQNSLNDGSYIVGNLEDNSDVRSMDAGDPGLPGAVGDGAWVTAVAMRYSEPESDRAVRYLVEKGCESIVLLPLYPHECAATTGSSLTDLNRRLEDGPVMPRQVTIRSFHDHPGYVKALAGKIIEGLDAFPADIRDQVTILFSAHAVPVRLAESGDPYVGQIEECVKLLLAELGDRVRRWRLAWQSRVGPVKWISPGTDEVIGELGREKAPGVLVVPVSFVSDHIETLHEVDIEFTKIAEESGIPHFHRSPSLNDSPLFIGALRDLVLGAAEGADL